MFAPRNGTRVPRSRVAPSCASASGRSPPQSRRCRSWIANVCVYPVSRMTGNGVASVGDAEVDAVADDVIPIPDVPEYLQPIVAAIPLQLLAYEIALLCGCDVDKPRNLAKSVTVE